MDTPQRTPSHTGANGISQRSTNRHKPISKVTQNKRPISVRAQQAYKLQTHPPNNEVLTWHSSNVHSCSSHKSAPEANRVRQSPHLLHRDHTRNYTGNLTESSEATLAISAFCELIPANQRLQCTQSGQLATPRTQPSQSASPFTPSNQSTPPTHSERPISDSPALDPANQRPRSLHPANQRLPST